MQATLFVVKLHGFDASSYVGERAAVDDVCQSSETRVVYEMHAWKFCESGKVFVFRCPLLE